MIYKAKSEPAVSPVIGTILLVAIAVILVAIILVVVMDFSGDTNEKKVGLNAKPATGNDATLILYGGASIDELIRLEMIDQGSPIGEYVKFWDINENESTFVGIPYLAENVAKPIESQDVYDTRINVRGTFTDGTEVILLVQPMTFYDVRGQPSPLSEYFEYLYFGAIDLLENNEQLIELPQYEGWHRTSAGVAVKANVMLKMAKPLPENFESFTLTLETIAPNQNTTSDYIKSTAITGSPNAGTAYSSASREGVRVMSAAGSDDYIITAKSLIAEMGVSGGYGGPFLFTITVNGKDGSILAAESIMLTTPLTGGSPSTQTVPWEIIP